MSHDYSLYCKRCKAHFGDEYNHAQDELAAAVKASYPLWLAKQAGWDVGSVEWSYMRVADFILEHWDHGGFLVLSEYCTLADPDRLARYPPLEVSPDVPGQQYAALALPGMIAELRDLTAGTMAILDRLQMNG